MSRIEGLLWQCLEAFGPRQLLHLWAQLSARTLAAQIHPKTSYDLLHHATAAASQLGPCAMLKVAISGLAMTAASLNSVVSRAVIFSRCGTTCCPNMVCYVRTLMHTQVHDRKRDNTNQYLHTASAPAKVEMSSFKATATADYNVQQQRFALLFLLKQS